MNFELKFKVCTCCKSLDFFLQRTDIILIHEYYMNIELK